MPSDIEIARAATLQPITEVAARIGIPDDALHHYGKHIAKIDHAFIKSLESKPEGKLVLVTAISPTPAGEGKTTTTVGLGDALNRIGQKTVMCLREPSLGPCFGMKGGAAGGGQASWEPQQLAPPPRDLPLRSADASMARRSRRSTRCWSSGLYSSICSKRSIQSQDPLYFSGISGTPEPEPEILGTRIVGYQFFKANFGFEF